MFFCNQKPSTITNLQLKYYEHIILLPRHYPRNFVAVKFNIKSMYCQ